MDNTPGDLTILGRGARFEGGKVRVDGDLRVDGDVEVDEIVVGERMIVTSSGTVNAKMIRAKEVVVAGTVDGTFRVTECLILKETGHTKGSITAARLIVEEGGVCDGMFSIGRGDQERPAVPVSAAAASGGSGGLFGGPGVKREGPRPVPKPGEEGTEQKFGSSGGGSASGSSDR